MPACMRWSHYMWVLGTVGSEDTAKCYSSFCRLGDQVLCAQSSLVPNTLSQHHTGKCSVTAGTVSRRPWSHGKQRAWRCPSSWKSSVVLFSPPPTPSPLPGEVSCSPFWSHSSEGWLVPHHSGAQQAPLPALQCPLCWKKEDVSNWTHDHFREKWLSRWQKRVVSWKGNIRQVFF